MRSLVLGVLCVVTALAAPPARGQVKIEISQALTAAPPGVAAGAAVVRMDARGHITKLRSGANGWTCIPPDNPARLGQQSFPSCFDKYGLEWLENFYADRKPNPAHIGYSYMLRGGWSWRNNDPGAKKLAPGQKDYIHLPPHIMVLSARVADTSGFPSGQADPDTSKPFVMFGGLATVGRQFDEQLALLEPFGEGNPVPVFLLRRFSCIGITMCSAPSQVEPASGAMA